MHCSSSLHGTPTLSASCSRNHCLIVVVAAARASLFYFEVKRIDSKLS